MQTGIGGLNLAQVVGSLVACALVLGGFYGLFSLKKRRREQRKERPPQREKLLRPAGYSAMCRIDALWEKWTWAAAGLGRGPGIVTYFILAQSFLPPLTLEKASLSHFQDPFDQFMPLVPAAAPSRASRLTTMKLRQHRPIKPPAGIGPGGIHELRCAVRVQQAHLRLDWIDYPDNFCVC
jgi:hypothetical protein